MFCEENEKCWEMRESPVEHVHHPVGEGVELVGVVPEDEPPHPLLVLTVTAQSTNQHCKAYF